MRVSVKEIVCDLQRGVPIQKSRLQGIVDYFERDLKPMHPYLDSLFMEDLVPTLRRLMRDQEAVLRFSDGTRPKGYVEISPDPTLKFIWGHEVWKNCLRTDQQTDMNASGTIPNHAFLGQFLTVRLVLTEGGEKVEAKMLLEIAGIRNRPALIGRGLYGYGYRVTEWLQEGVRLYGEWLGIPNERIFLPDGRFTAGMPQPPLIPPQNHFPGTFAILRE